MLVIEPKGKRKKKIVIKARYLEKPSKETEAVVAQHLASWGFFEKS